MSNKKGFTLVELLAVIAILAILVIIAMPNVLNMFMNAKKSSFVTEAQNVIKQVTNKYIDESLKGNHISTISNDNNPLDLSGNIKYEIEIDSQGNVTSYIISNDSYCISSSKKYNELTKDDVKDDCSYESLHNIAGTLSKDFYSKTGRTAKDVVSSITFYSDGRTIDATEKYDVSEAQDNSIIMYVNPTNENSSLIDLTIVANGKIMFPEDSTKLFYFRSKYPCGPYASALSKLEFNSSIDTSKVKSMNSMFGGIITEVIDLSDFNTANVEDMSRLFYESEVKEIKGLEKFDTSKVTDMSGMFSGTKVKNLNLSSFDTSKVTDMSFMFQSTKVENLNLRVFNTSNVTSMNSMFSGSSATTLDLSSFDTSKVTNMSWMFYGSSATTLDLSSFDTSKVTNINDMFYNTAATKGYAKDSATASKFNSTKGKPSRLTFTVK